MQKIISKIAKWATGSALLLILVAFLSFAVHAQSSSSTVTVLTGARLLDGTGHAPLEDSTLIIKNDRIVAVGPAGKVRIPEHAKQMDMHGKTIIPGLISAHSHLALVVDGKTSPDNYTRENVETELLQFEQYGVTAILSLGLNRDLIYDLRDQQRSGNFPGATIFTAGRGIGVLGGAPPVGSPDSLLYQPKTPDEARAAVREMAAHRPDMIKIWVDDFYGKLPKMSPEIYRAVIEEAHRNQIRVAAHVFYLADAKALLADGVDMLAHSIRDQPVDAHLISMMKSRGVWYVPTFTVDESAFIFAEDPSLMRDAFFRDAVTPNVLAQLNSEEYRKKIAADPSTPKVKAALAMGMRNLKTLHDAGVNIAFGTDSGANMYRVPGWAEHHELELMVRAGLTPMDALVAATQGSANAIGAENRGTIQEGNFADFLVLAANPFDDIRNSRQMEAIWHNGKQIQPRVPATSEK